METAKHLFTTDLYAVPGLDKANRSEALVTTAWQFAHSLLWNHQSFSLTEQREAKYFIKQFLFAGGKPRKAFLNFCQRIILTRQNITSFNTDYLALPSMWFDDENVEGFASSREWLQAVKTLRHSLPGYRIEIKALAEAVLEFSEEPTEKNFHYWRFYFIERNQPILLHLFGVYCSNQQFNIH
jgi:hypothetical protein